MKVECRLEYGCARSREGPQEISIVVALDLFIGAIRGSYREHATTRWEDFKIGNYTLINQATEEKIRPMGSC